MRGKDMGFETGRERESSDRQGQKTGNVKGGEREEEQN